MNQLLYLLLLLACPLMMVVMMRGVHGGGHHGGHRSRDEAPPSVDTTARDARISELEHEVARLRSAREAENEDKAVAERRR